MEEVKSSAKKRIRREILVAGIFFIIWIVFFDDHNLLRHYQNKQKLQQLTDQKAYLKEKIISDKHKIEELQTDKDNLEKFAREQFLMKKTNEDIFLIEEEK